MQLSRQMKHAVKSERLNLRAAPIIPAAKPVNATSLGQNISTQHTTGTGPSASKARVISGLCMLFFLLRSKLYLPEPSCQLMFILSQYCKAVFNFPP